MSTDHLNTFVTTETIMLIFKRLQPFGICYIHVDFKKKLKNSPTKQNDYFITGTTIKK